MGAPGPRGPFHGEVSRAGGEASCVASFCGPGSQSRLVDRPRPQATPHGVPALSLTRRETDGREGRAVTSDVEERPAALRPGGVPSTRPRTRVARGEALAGP